MFIGELIFSKCRHHTMKNIRGGITPFRCKGLLPQGKSQGSECSGVTLMAQNPQMWGLTHSLGWGFSLATGDMPLQEVCIWQVGTAGFPPKGGSKVLYLLAYYPDKEKGKLMSAFVVFFVWLFFWFSFALFSVCCFFFFSPKPKTVALVFSFLWSKH